MLSARKKKNFIVELQVSALQVLTCGVSLNIVMSSSRPPSRTPREANWPLSINNGTEKVAKIINMAAIA